MSGNQKGKDPDFGNPDEFNMEPELEDFPESPPAANPSSSRRAAAAAPSDDGYDDIDNNGMQNEDDALEVSDGNEVVEEDDEPAGGPSLASRLMVPVGFGVLALVGIAGGWSMGLLDPILGSNDTSQQTVVQQQVIPRSVTPTPLPVVPQVATPSGPAVLPPRPQVAQMPPLPQPSQGVQPTFGQGSPGQVLLPGIPNTLQAGLPLPLPGTQPMSFPDLASGQRPVMPPTSTAEQQPMPDVAMALNGLVEEMRAARTGGSSSDLGVEIRSMRDNMATRFDGLDGRIGVAIRRADASDARLNAIEARIAALVSGRMAAIPTPTTPRGRPADVTPNADAPAASRGNVTGFTLVGASRDAALVRTPQGIVQVEIGRALPGGAIANSFRQENGNWVLVTSAGDVRP